jgi:predicted deacylase
MNTTSKRLERIDQPIKQLPSGDWLSIAMFRIQGTAPGPHLHIQSSVHGAEVQGNAVIYRLMEWFLANPFNGSVTLIPMANPIAINHKSGTFTTGRFNPVTGDNWNRAYEDLFSRPKEQLGGTSLEEFARGHAEKPWALIKKEFKLFLHQCYKNLEGHLSKQGFNENKHPFLLLQKIACSADIMLDLHTGPEAIRYIYSAEYQRQDVVHLNFPFVLHIPNEFARAMDEATFINWVRLQKAFSALGKEVPLDFNSYTLELGSEEVIDLEAARLDANNILHYLQHKDMIAKGSINIEKVTQWHGQLEQYKTIYAPRAGLVQFNKKAGDFFQAGDSLATILNFRPVQSALELSNALWELKAQEAGVVINHSPSAVIGQGTDIFQVLYNPQKI